MMAVCYLTLMLVVTSVGSGDPPTYDHLNVYGDCPVRSGTVSVYVAPFSRELVIVREFDMFRIDLPEQAGHYKLRYVLGRDTAEFRPGGPHPVKRGPKALINTFSSGEPWNSPSLPRDRHQRLNLIDSEIRGTSPVPRKRWVGRRLGAIPAFFRLKISQFSLSFIHRFSYGPLGHLHFQELGKKVVLAKGK